jgi:hypothetical protein
MNENNKILEITEDALAARLVIQDKTIAGLLESVRVLEATLELQKKTTIQVALLLNRWPHNYSAAACHVCEAVSKLTDNPFGCCELMADYLNKIPKDTTH